MTKETFDKSIRTGEVQLALSDKLCYYGIVVFYFFIPLVFLLLHFFDYFKGTPKDFMRGEIVFITFLSCVGLFFYVMQKERLKFKIVETTLKRSELLYLIRMTGKELNWLNMRYKNNVFTATTDPPFYSGSWGERITILFYQRKVFINSICDLSKQTTIISLGRNTKNEKAVIDVIEKNQSLAV